MALSTNTDGIHAIVELFDNDQLAEMVGYALAILVLGHSNNPDKLWAKLFRSLELNMEDNEEDITEARKRFCTWVVVGMAQK